MAMRETVERHARSWFGQWTTVRASPTAGPQVEQDSSTAAGNVAQNEGMHLRR
jgi:hypothetical protein